MKRFEPRIAMSSAFRKYLLLQIPGWVLGAVVVVLIREWGALPVWSALAIFTFWVGKDFLIYPFVRSSFEVNHRTGMGRLVGARGTTRDGLDPKGYVLVGGELWQAETEADHPPIPPGGAVRIQKSRGMTLIVTADAEIRPAPQKRI